MRMRFGFAATLYIVVCIMGSVTGALAAPPAAAGLPGKIGASSVWPLPESFIASAHAACDKSAPTGFAECFISQMAKAGAPARVTCTSCLGIREAVHATGGYRDCLGGGGHAQ